MAGRPRGIWADKAWRDALRLAARRPAGVADPKPKTNLDAMAIALIASAKKGDVPALKEIGDRLDGKVPQALIGGDKDDPPVAVQLIELRAVQPK